MAVTFVGSDVAGGNVATLATNDLVWPTVQADDVALIFWTFQSTTTPTTPSGFTLVTNTDNASGSTRTYIYRKVCTGSESGDFPLTISGANRQSVCLVVYRGVDTTTPVDGTSVDNTHTTATTHNNPAYTPSVNNCVILTSVHERATNIDTDWTAPSGWTERADTLTEATGSGGTITAVADDGLASGRDTSAVTPPDWTGNHGTGTPNIVTYTLALRAASSGTDHTVDQTDSAGLTDTVAKSVEKAPTDSAGLTDTTATEIASVATDSAGLTDTVTVAPSKLVEQTDSAGLTDTTAQTLAPIITDSVGLTDQTVLDRTLVVTDSAGLTDTSTVESGKALGATDSAGLTDTTALQRSLVPTDSAGLTDSTEMTGAKVITDSTGLSDSAAVGLVLGVTQTDSAGLTDATAVQRGTEATDLAGLTDYTASQQSVTFTDDTGLTDPATASVAYIPAFHGIDGSTSSTGLDNSTAVSGAYDGATTTGSVMA